MANEIRNVLTNAGRALFTNSLNQGRPVVFAFAKVGSQLPAGTDVIEDFTALKNPYNGSNAVIARKRITDEGALIISVQFNNTGLTSALYVKEVGIYAKLGAEPGNESTVPAQSDSEAILFSYLTMGAEENSDLVLPAASASVQRVYDIPFVFNGSANITVTISPAAMITDDDTLSASLDSSGNSNSGNAGKVLRLNADGKYDVNITGNAEKLGGQLPSYYAAADHDHSDATTDEHGYLSTTDKGRLDTLHGRVNQDLRTSATPTFQGLTVNGYIDNAKFR